MKLGVDTYTTHSQGWDMFQTLDYLKKIEVDVAHLAGPSLAQSQDEDFLRSVKQHADKLGLEIETGMGSICPTSTTFRAQNGDTAEERVRLMLHATSILGSRVLKCFLGGRGDRRTDIPLKAHIQNSIATLKAVREQAMDLGIKIAVENHGDLQGRELRMLVREAGPEYVGVCFDGGNPTHLGEDPLVALEHVAPYVLTGHIRDSVIWSHPKGAAVQWVAMGDGNIGIQNFAERYKILCPNATFTIEILTGSPPRILNYLEDEYWDEFPDMPAWEFARFERLVRKGQPYMGTMVTIAGGDEVPPEYRAARIVQERYDLERSVRYCKEVLGIGE